MFGSPERPSDLWPVIADDPPGATVGTPATNASCVELNCELLKLGGLDSGSVVLLLAIANERVGTTQLRRSQDGANRRAFDMVVGRKEPCMATVSFFHVGNVTSIPAGSTHHWVWNNAPAQRVWAFSVDAMVPINIPPQVGATAMLQVTSVEYREIYNGGSSFEKEVHFWIKNTGSISANYAIHMTEVSQ
jgi:hypothetical protein